MAYGGLGDYLRPKEQAADTRSGESKRRATEVSAWGVAAQRMASEVEDEAWAEHRRVQDTVVGVDRGLISREDIKAYQEHSRQNRFGRVQANGHLVSGVTVPGGTAPAPVYRSQLGEDQPGQRVSPLLAHLRNSGDTERWG